MTHGGLCNIAGPQVPGRLGLLSKLGVKVSKAGVLEQGGETPT